MKIKQLLERYNLKTRQSIYNWCEAVKITLEKDSQGHAYATPEQVKLLDQLAEHLDKPGATLSSFTPMSITTIDSKLDIPIDIPIDTITDRKISPVHQQIDNQLLGEILNAIASHLTPPDPLWYMTILERARVSEWLLTTTEVEKLIGVKPRTEKNQKSYKRGNWIFVKAGKIGNQTAWRVMKESNYVAYKVENS